MFHAPLPSPAVRTRANAVDEIYPCSKTPLTSLAQARAHHESKHEKLAWLESDYTNVHECVGIRVAASRLRVRWLSRTGVSADVTNQRTSRPHLCCSQGVRRRDDGGRRGARHDQRGEAQEEGGEGRRQVELGGWAPTRVRDRVSVTSTDRCTGMSGPRVQLQVGVNV